jgi:hypothetical protein
MQATAIFLLPARRQRTTEERSRALAQAHCSAHYSHATQQLLLLLLLLLLVS